MATSIFYEFLLANKHPRNPLYCHNALVFAPDKTVLESLREIITFDKSKVVPAEYLSWLDANLKFHFLDDTSSQLSTIDNSKYNIVISNTQKIILKKEHSHKSAAQTLFGEETGKYAALSFMKKFAELGGEDTDANIEEDMFLINNPRFAKLVRLKQLGIYVDEAHHVFGNKLAEDLLSNTKATSLRVTINELAANLAKSGSRVVACYNYTGTPYVKNRLLPEVVYSYGLREAIDKGYLKRVEPYAYENIRNNTQLFCHDAITHFWRKCGEKRVEGMLPKMAFFASSIEEAVSELRPAIERELVALDIPTSRILVNVGDSKYTSNDDEREFKRLDSASSEKQFIILVGKGKEGWNCRSLFAVAMYRKANSTVFVLQSTMRCLRQIGDHQHTAYLYFSQENMDILNKELQENFNITLEDMRSAGEEANVAEVRIVKKAIKVKVRKVHKLYDMKRKQIPEHVDLELDKVDVDRYRVIRSGRNIYDLTKEREREDITSSVEKREFSPFTLVGEIARYLQMSPLEIKRILQDSKDGIDDICKRVNEFNEILYDEVIPRLFKDIYDIQEYKKEEEVELELVKDPKEKGQDCYRVKYKHGLLASYNSDEYRDYRDKTFNVDNYCFDSHPEFDMFWTLLHDERLSKVWFTGMLTAGQTEFVINYIDPESNTVRSYYPDFLVQKQDGSYVIVEVKGDNMIDNAIVQAKKEYAKQMASASSMEYVMIPGTKAKERILI
jgi:hypothetical protein